MFINLRLPAILCSDSLMFPQSTKLILKYALQQGIKFQKCVDINNLSDFHCITLIRKTWFLSYPMIIFDKKIVWTKKKSYHI